jgi:hypothetical protein
MKIADGVADAGGYDLQFVLVRLDRLGGIYWSYALRVRNGRWVSLNSDYQRLNTS